MSVWSDLVGQEEAVEVLRAAAAAARREAASGTVADAAMTHAWLFTGPPGSGRSVAARALAAALQCTATPPGCGECDGCHTTLVGTHADVQVVATEELSVGHAEAVRIVAGMQRRPSVGRWRVVIIEDADRLTDEAANALLKVIEEPPERSVLLLCAPSTNDEDVLPTIRSRCRLVPLHTPSSAAVAEVLIRRDGVDPAMAHFVAQVTQGHVGRAGWLARSDDARRARRQVLEIPRQIANVPGCFAAAEALIGAAEEESSDRHRDDIERETVEVKTAYGVGATGKGVASATRGSAGALKELDRRQKLRTKRSQRDAIDRALLDLMGFYRDVLAIQLSGDGPVQLVHVDVGESIAEVARTSSPETTIRRIDAIRACRTAIDENVTPQLAIEAMLLTMRSA